MGGIAPIALFALAGILIGGCWSLYKQGAKRRIIAIVGVFAVLAAAGGVALLMAGQP
jgi:hypothetical protein